MNCAWKSTDRGGTLLEFTLVASVFLVMLLAITSGANLYFTHNALVEATRRGARFAATQAASTPAGTITSGANVGPSVANIKNFAIYGNADGTGTKLLSSLDPSNISIQYDGFGVGTGSVSVHITNYNYNLVIPGISRQITMPPYKTTVTGESAGTVPTTCP